MEITLKEIALLLGGEIDGDENTLISGLSGIDKAGPGDITFVANPKYARYIATTQASAIVCAAGTVAPGRNLVRVDNPYLAYAKALRFLNPLPKEPGTIDPQACIAAGVQLGSNVTIYPFVYIGPGCRIGDNVTIYPHCFIGRNVSIGCDTLLHPNVTVEERCIIGCRVIIHAGSVIGSDGFGFARDGAAYYKIPQLGIVQIDDDVEIGACTAIDRAAMDRTWIKRGTKTDNLVQIAHNVVIGEDSCIVAQTGISGSTKLGDRVIMAGQSAAVGHITIGSDCIVGARGAVASDLAEGQIVSGAPAIPHKEFLKATMAFPKLPEMRRTISQLAEKVKELEAQLRTLQEKNPT
jgi:UDP-3-O-[3-hydroxymyristoyl] glucosamine N-acyltransferase